MIQQLLKVIHFALKFRADKSSVWIISSLAWLNQGWLNGTKKGLSRNARDFFPNQHELLEYPHISNILLKKIYYNVCKNKRWTGHHSDG